jgi:hypothetical protein
LRGVYGVPLAAGPKMASMPRRHENNTLEAAARLNRLCLLGWSAWNWRQSKRLISPGTPRSCCPATSRSKRTLCLPRSVSSHNTKNAPTRRAVDRAHLPAIVATSLWRCKSFSCRRGGGWNVMLEDSYTFNNLTLTSSSSSSSTDNPSYVIGQTQIMMSALR